MKIVAHEQTTAKSSHHLVFVKRPSQAAVAILVLEGDGEKKHGQQASKLSLASQETCVILGQQTPGYYITLVALQGRFNYFFR